MVVEGRERKLRIERDSVSNEATKDNDRRLMGLYMKTESFDQTEFLQRMMTRDGCVRAVPLFFARSMAG
jgi:hypothetical protein